MSTNVAELVRYDDISQVVERGDADFLIQTAEQVDMSSLIQPHSPTGADLEQVRAYQQRIIGAVERIEEESGLTKISDEEILEILWMTYYSGALLNPENIHIHDLCGGDGRTSLFSAFAREGWDITSVTCFDTEYRENIFGFLAKHLKIAQQLRNYLHHDVATADLNKRKDRDTYWVARRPNGMAATLMKRLLELPQVRMPSSLTILPSEWYGYAKDESQIGEVSDIEIWERLANIRSAFHLNLFEALAGKRLSKEQELVIGITERVMDCLRIAGVNDRSQLVHGNLQEFPNRNRKDLLVLRKSD
jgi:hypothetical protein